MSFSIGSVVATVTADISGFRDGMKQVEKSAENFQTKLQSVGSKLTDFGKNMTLVSTVVGAGLTMFLKDSSEQANNLERSLTTLDIISERFGVSGEKAKESAQALGKELRIGVGPAAAGLQNLLKSGLNLDQATDLMKRFTNEAITGKSSSITLAQAVENLSFAYTTNNSAIGNLSGINENFINIIDKGRTALIASGVAANTITDEMAKYRGMIDLTNLTMGSAERFHGSLIDKQAELEQSMTTLKVSFGQLINPILAQVVDMLTQVVQWFTSLSEAQKTTILIILGVITVIGPLLVILGFLVTGLSTVITVVGTLGTALAFLAFNPIAWVVVAIIGLIAAGIWLIKHWDDVKEFATALWAHVVSGWNSLVATVRSIGSSVLDAIMWPFNEAKKRIQEAVDWIKDRLDFTKRHSPSVVDIVTNGVDKVNEALGGLNWTGSVSGTMAGASVSNGGDRTSNVVVRVDMAGAFIADTYGATQMAEMMGDSLIKRLQGNLRI